MSAEGLHSYSVLFFRHDRSFQYIRPPEAVLAVIHRSMAALDYCATKGPGNGAKRRAISSDRAALPRFLLLSRWRGGRGPLGVGGSTRSVAIASDTRCQRP